MTTEPINPIRFTEKVKQVNLVKMLPQYIQTKECKVIVELLESTFNEMFTGVDGYSIEERTYDGN